MEYYFFLRIVIVVSVRDCLTDDKGTVGVDREEYIEGIVLDFDIYRGCRGTVGARSDNGLMFVAWDESAERQLYFSKFVSSLQTYPSFAEPISNITVVQGRDASIPCVVNNLGTYKVAWIHMDRQMILTIHKHIISRIPRFSVSYDGQRTWFLNIASTQPVDRGYYMCQVNTNPMMSQVGYLEIVVPPDILDGESSPSSVAVRENQNLSVTCKASGFPSPRIMWRREDGGEILLDRRNKVSMSLFKGETMQISRVHRSDMGAYLCIATNGIPPSVSKRITIDVEFAPNIVVSNQLVGAPLNTDVTIDCEVEAHPRAISYWMFGSDMLLSPNKHPTDVNENSYRSRVKLTVKKLQQTDYGTYKCVAKNSLGENEGTVRIYEIAFPSKTTESGENLNEILDDKGGCSSLTRGTFVILVWSGLTLISLGSLLDIGGCYDQII